MKRLSGIAAVCGVLLAGCSGGDPSSTAVTETAASPSSASSPSPTVSSSPTVSDLPTWSPLDPEHPLGDLQVPFWPGTPGDFGDVFFAGADLSHFSHYVEGVTTSEARGSGCTPPSGTSLPDGIWFGHVAEWGQAQIEFDLYCINNFDQFRNKYPVTLQLPVSGRAQYLIGWEAGSLWHIPYAFSYADVVAARDEYPPPTFSNYVWVYINGGEVTQVEVWLDTEIGNLKIEGSPYFPWGARLEPAQGTSGEYFPVFEWDRYRGTSILTPNHSDPPQKGVLGSGCSPGPGDALPDGVWFGYINEMTDGTLTFDLACNWSYDSPELWNDTEECWTVEGTGLRNERCNDLLASNDDKRVRTNPLASDAQVLVYSYGGAAYSADTIAGLENEFWPFDPTFGNWIYVNDGEVTAIAP